MALAFGSGCSNTKQYDEPQLLRWDFSQEADYNYSFYQTTESTTNTHLKYPNMEGFQDDQSHYRSVARGKLKISSKGDQTAAFSLNDLTMNAYQMDISTGMLMDSMVEELEPMVLNDIGENGKALMPDEMSQQFFDYLFPLPVGELTKGQSEEIDLNVPVNSIGYMMMVKGKSKMTFTDVVKHKGRTCAQLDVELLLDQLDSAQTEGTDLEYFRYGKSTFYFDLEKRKFLSGKVQMTNNIDMDGGPDFGAMNLESVDEFTLELVP